MTPLPTPAIAVVEYTLNSAKVVGLDNYVLNFTRGPA